MSKHDLLSASHDVGREVGVEGRCDVTDTCGSQVNSVPNAICHCCNGQAWLAAKCQERAYIFLLSDTVVSGGFCLCQCVVTSRDFNRLLICHHRYTERPIPFVDQHTFRLCDTYWKAAGIQSVKANPCCPLVYSSLYFCDYHKLPPELFASHLRLFATIKQSEHQWYWKELCNKSIV